MKKLARMLPCLLAVCLCLLCMAYTSAEESSTCDVHIAFCSAPTVCVNCGQSDVKIGIIEHNWDRDNYEYDEYFHWTHCLDCNIESSHNSHYGSCLTGVCNDCGATGLDSEILHEFDYENPQWDSDAHWSACIYCGKELEHNTHQISCTDGACVVCHQTGVNGDIKHDYDWYQVQHNDTHHWWICMYCNQEVDKWEHHLSCETGACVECRATGVEGEVHHELGDFEYDDDECWRNCETCGEELWRQEHIAACNGDPNTCVNCGATGVNCSVDHAAPDVFYHDEDNHWHICTWCKEKVWVDPHELDCVTGDTCIWCGATGVNGEVAHQWEKQFDDNEHWTVCTACGEELDRDNHWLNCQTGACEFCGATDVNGEILHYMDGYYHDDNECWQICDLCGEEYWRQEHIAFCDGDATTCVNCGATGVNCYVEHNWGEYSYDDKFHWAFCQDCGEESNHNSHWGSCLTGTCDCGATGLDPDILHQCDFEHYESDETNHWFVCDNCGEDFFVFEHEVDEDGTCLQCGKTGLPTHEHVWVEKVVTPATCTEAGEKHIVCDECDEFQKSEEIPALGHTEKTTETPATCTNDGRKVTTCETCGETLKTEKIPALGHTEKVTETPATCTEDGSIVISCEECGEILETEPIPALGHTEKVTETPATCTEDGSVVITCEECGEILETEPIPALGHTEKVTEIAATCTADGSIVIICEECGEILETEPIPALGHKEKTTEIAATCTEGGSKVTRCETCGETLKTEKIPALGHTEKVTETPATCTEGGSKVTTCETCGETLKTEKIPALGHKEKTTEIAATCTEGGSKVTTCETCGEVLKTETSYALEHAPKERVIDATCTEAGQKRTYCNRCGDLLNVEEIPALGHETRVKVVKRATCTSDGEAKVYCVRCNAVLETMTIPAAGHQFTGEDATVCAVCNYVQGGEEAPSAVTPMVLPDDVAATAVATVAVADAPETIKVEVLEVAQTDYQKLAFAADIAPVKVFALQLDIATSMEDMMDMTIPEKITLAVELTEEEAAELENMKMVIILEDGSMQEITFEIEDGKLIFAIEQQGVFAFVPAEKVI